MKSLVALELAATALMTGVIWAVQLLIYPAFGNVTRDGFARFHQTHSRRITWIVGPAMLIELAAAGALALDKQNIFWWTNLAGVLALWASTGLLSVPLHDRLGREGNRADLVRRLVRTNWPRTCLWSLRLIALLALSTAA